jgi:membrane-associated phospholipid phosphatase
MSLDRPPSWQAEIAFRMRRHLALKLIGTTAVIWIFFIGYFHLLRHVAYPVTVMPLTPLDGLVPIAPWAIVPYLTLWFYVGIAPGLQRTFVQLVVYGLWSALLLVIGLGIFYRWPTMIPTFVFERSGYPGFDLLRGIDAPGNACPSMHVAFAMFTALWIDVLLRECRVPAPWRLVNALWFLAIAYSTIAIRQHVVLDAVAGAALGAAVAVPSIRWRPQTSLRLVAGDAPAMIEAPTRPDGIAGVARIR